jgi:hypothetical protein
MAGNSELSNDESSLTDAESEASLLADLEDSSLTQHWVRFNRDGLDRVVSYYRCAFPADSRRTILHVPFHPPMAEAPTVHAMAVDDPGVRIRVTDRQRFGLRLELSLDHIANEPRSALIEIIAESSAWQGTSHAQDDAR